MTTTNSSNTKVGLLSGMRYVWMYGSMDVVSQMTLVSPSQQDLSLMADGVRCTTVETVDWKAIPQLISQSTQSAGTVAVWLGQTNASGRADCRKTRHFASRVSC